ncbi:N-acetyltransferase [Erysipelotrichaceae bacterium OttesenSCG-928-M19]|nr:N-acetyltransferase [Erysipelotrichaceae bacterium OttesenSCG-928-M19]
MQYEIEKNRITLLDDNGKYCGDLTFIKKGLKVIDINHTYVPDEYRGQGYAALLLAKAVEYAKEKNKKIIPSCPYARRAFEKNEEYQELEYHG